MSDWPLPVRFAIVAMAIAATVAAFVHGVMVLAIPGVVLCGWTFHRAFLADL